MGGLFRQKEVRYEFELMRTFMKDQNMNWRVAFTSQNVMNMDYGVLDIPHIVIIDAKGKCAV